MPTILGYARVSTAEQAVRGVSLAAQRQRIAAYCEAHGLELAGIEEDAGISAKATRNRPALQRALSALKRREADGLVAVKLDRLSRTTRDVLDLVAISAKQGWALHSIDDKLDTGCPQGRFVVTILGALAQLEREQTAERTKVALAEIRRQGRRVSGRPPYGFRFEAGRLVAVPEEAELLDRLLALHAEGLGAKAICTRLAKAGIGNPRTGGPWRHGTVRGAMSSAGAANPRKSGAVASARYRLQGIAKSADNARCSTCLVATTRVAGVLAGMAFTGRRLRAGDPVGPYVLKAPVASGGQGEVWVATLQRGTLGLSVGERVVLKFIHRSALSAEGMFKRIIREAEISKHVRARGVRRIYEVDVLTVHKAIRVFVVAELVPGQSLAALLQEHGRLDHQCCLRIAEQVSLSLSAVHAAGIVHRDIKPANLLVTECCDTVLIDFGIATFEDDAQVLTPTGMVLGTPEYVAPERERGQCDARSDLYSLGVVLREACSHEPEPDGDSHDAYWRLVSSMVHDDPEKRPQSAHEVHRASKRLLADLLCRTGKRTSDTELACRRYRAALRRYQDLRCLRGRVEATFLLSRALEQGGDNDQAKIMFERHMRLRQKWDSSHRQRQMRPRSHRRRHRL